VAAAKKTIDEVIKHFRSAEVANRENLARRGNIVNLTRDSAEEIVVSADLHGNRLNFSRLVDVADLEHHPKRHLIMHEVCHGGPTYPNSLACMSHQLLEDVAKLKSRFPEQFHFLLGNHELAELTDFPILKGGKVLNLMYRDGLQAMYGDSAEEVRTASQTFLRSCPLAVRIDGRVLISHSIPTRVDLCSFDRSVLEREYEASDMREGGSVFRLLWGRDYRPENAAAFANLMEVDVLLQGHEPCADGFMVPNKHQIILDCCNQRATYLQWRLDESPTHAQLVARISRLADRKPVCTESVNVPAR